MSDVPSAAQRTAAYPAGPAPDQRVTELGEKRQKTRLRIIKGAALAFAQHGLDDTTVAHILAAAGVSRRTYYQFFADKLDVLMCLYERSTGHLMERRRAAMAEPGSGLERMLRGHQVYLDFVSSAGPLIQVMASEAMRPSSPLMQRRLWLHQSIQDLYCSTYREAEGVDLDPLAVRGLILFTESLTLHVLLQRPGEPAVLEQARQILERHLAQLVEDAQKIGDSP